MEKANNYKLIFDKLEDEDQSSCDSLNMEEFREIQELADLAMEINNEQVYTYTTS